MTIGKSVRKLLDALEAAERERDETATNLADERDAVLKRCRKTAQVIISAIGSVGPENAEDAAARIVARLADVTAERDRLRVRCGELFLAGQVAKLREERDAAIAKCEQLAAERPISVDMYDHVSAELEACKAAAAEAGVDGIPLPDAIRRLGSLNDKAEEKEADLSRQVYELKARICKMDCRYTMGEVADISGSHCNEPCDRCAARRERESLEAELEACKAKLAAVEAGLVGFIANAEDECFELLEKRMSRYGLWREVPEDPTP